MIENMKRSEKYRLFKDLGIPRYVLLDEKAKRKEQIFWSSMAFLMLVLSMTGRTDVQRVFGKLALFIICLFGVFYR